MAENPYVNKVETADGNTLMDITDTTAGVGDVASGQVFYAASGARSVGTLDISGKVDENELAFSEAGDTATQYISNGSYVFWKNNFYQAIRSISLGDTLADTGESPNLSAISNILNTLRTTKANVYSPTFIGELSLGRTAGSMTASYSVAIGRSVTANANNSFASGYQTTASGSYSHTESRGTHADGSCSHAEGYYCSAYGEASHAEGYYSSTYGDASHIEGRYTYTNEKDIHVSGRYNSYLDPTNFQTWEANTSYEIGDYIKYNNSPYVCTVANNDSEFNANHWSEWTGTYAEIIGNGTSTSDRSNARTLDWDGNEMLAGGLKINDKAHNSNGVQLFIDSGDCQYHNIFFRKNGETVAKIVVNTGTTGDTISNGRFYFTQYSPKSTADSETTGYYQRYDLPGVTAGLTENETYNILTSKSAVTIAQGGTGMTGVSTDSVTTNGITASCRKWGKVVQVSLSGTLTSTFAKSTNFITLPSGYRPAAAIRPFAKHNGNVDMLYVGTNGGINNADNDCAKKTLYSTFTFIIS